MVWAWLFYVLFAAACVPGIQVQPRCCATGALCSPCGSTAPAEFQVTLSGFINNLCDQCTTLDGTYILTKVTAADDVGDPLPFVGCVWGYCGESPCEPGNALQIQLRIQSDGGGGLNVFLAISLVGVDGCPEWHSLDDANLGIKVGQWNKNVPGTEDCSSISSLSMDPTPDPSGLGSDPNCDLSFIDPDSSTPPTAMVSAV